MAARKTTAEGGIDAVAIAALLKHPSKPTSIPMCVASLPSTSSDTDNHLRSILQYRPPVKSLCVELPAGLIDKGESPETSAIRELYEETGYGGDAFEGRIKVLELGGTVVSDPGASSSLFSLFPLPDFVSAETDTDDTWRSYRTINPCVTTRHEQSQHGPCNARGSAQRGRGRADASSR